MVSGVGSPREITAEVSGISIWIWQLGRYGSSQKQLFGVEGVEVKL